MFLRRWLQSQAFLLLSALLTAIAVPHALASQPVRTGNAEVSLHSHTVHAVPGEAVWVALSLTPDEGWHTYWKNPGDSGLPTRIDWQLPDGVTASDIHWPRPARYGLDEYVNYGYSERTLHLVRLYIPADWPAGAPVRGSARADWLICSDICVPEHAELTLELPTSTAPAAVDPLWQVDFEQALARLPQEVDWTAVKQHDAGALLRWHVATSEADTSARYSVFPEHPELIDHSAPQHLFADGDGLWLEQAEHPYFESLPSRSAWVVVAHHANGDVDSWRVTAHAGSVPPRGDDVAAVSLPAANNGSGAGTAGTSSTPLWLVLAGALLGGLLLNLMPCVFPVLALKALGVLHARDGTRTTQRLHALAYTGGVIASCLVVAAVLLILRAGGAALGWGFQLQSPVFIATLAVLFFAFGLSLHGVFSLGTRIMGLGQGLTEHQGFGGSFATGILAVVVASPCTAPFMGVALGYAIFQPPAISLTVFAMLGLGLASPFLLIGFVPRLATLLPRPGAWMEHFKKAMAFPMYLSAAWLLWVLSRQAGSEALLAVLVALILAALAATLWHSASTSARVLRWSAVALCVALIASPLVRDAQAPIASVADDAPDAQRWSPARVAELRARGDTVFVNFTADWCITCLANERVVLASSAARTLFEAEGVHYLKADWTRADPVITEALAEFGRNGVPLYLVYPEGGDAIVLPQVLTMDAVRSAVTMTR